MSWKMTHTIRKVLSQVRDSICIKLFDFACFLFFLPPFLSPFLSLFFLYLSFFLSLFLSFFLPSFMEVCIWYTGSCLWAHTGVYVCGRGGIFLDCSSFYLLRKVVFASQSSQILVKAATQLALGILCFCLPSIEITGHCHACLAFFSNNKTNPPNKVSGDQTPVCTLAQQALYPLSHLSSPLFYV